MQADSTVDSLTDWDQEETERVKKAYSLIDEGQVEKAKEVHFSALAFAHGKSFTDEHGGGDVLEAVASMREQGGKVSRLTTDEDDNWFFGK